MGRCRKVINNVLLSRVFVIASDTYFSELFSDTNIRVVLGKVTGMNTSTNTPTRIFLSNDHVARKSKSYRASIRAYTRGHATGNFQVINETCGRKRIPEGDSLHPLEHMLCVSDN